MDTPKGQTRLAEHLVQELNALVESLSLPLTLTTPYDLTPSLLLAILECILRARLPISEAIRESQTPAAKVEAMKIFLGVLEDDVLHTDIGLSEIDPRRLAAGEWDDLVFVGETLCWLARQRGTSVPMGPTRGSGDSSSAGSNRNTSVYTGFSHIDPSGSSATTVPLDVHPTLSGPYPTSQGPRCIHEVEMSSFSVETRSGDLDASLEFCDCNENAYSKSSLTAPVRQPAWFHFGSSASARHPVRYHGLIEHVDDDISIFEASQEQSRRQTVPHTSHDGSISPRNWNGAAHISSPYYTLSLLEERSRLLGELAKMTMGTGRSFPPSKPS